MTTHWCAITCSKSEMNNCRVSVHTAASQSNEMQSIAKALRLIASNDTTYCKTISLTDYEFVCGRNSYGMKC